MTAGTFSRSRSLYSSLAFIAFVATCWTTTTVNAQVETKSKPRSDESKSETKSETKANDQEAEQPLEWTERFDRRFLSHFPLLDTEVPELKGFDESGNKFDLAKTRGGYTVIVFGCMT